MTQTNASKSNQIGAKDIIEREPPFMALVILKLLLKHMKKV